MKLLPLFLSSLTETFERGLGPGSSAVDWIVVVGGAVLALALYFLPSIVGSNKRNAAAILMLNFFLGWTFFGWVIALVWATTKDAAPAPQAR